MEYLFFWGETDTNGFMSNFYKTNFRLDNKNYNCSEQYFMKKKQELFDPSNTELGNLIMNEIKPFIIKKYGRKVKNFNEEIWNKHKYKYMYDGVYAKFSQNTELKEKLLKTKDKILVEASPYDKIWGIGFTKENAIKNKSKWGENLLGKILMEIRDKLKS